MCLKFSVQEFEEFECSKSGFKMHDKIDVKSIL